MPKIETVTKPEPGVLKKAAELGLGVAVLAAVTFSFIQAVNFYRFARSQTMGVLLFDLNSRLPEIQKRYNDAVAAAAAQKIEAEKKAEVTTTTEPVTTTTVVEKKNKK